MGFNERLPGRPESRGGVLPGSQRPAAGVMERHRVATLLVPLPLAGSGKSSKSQEEDGKAPRVGGRRTSRPFYFWNMTP